MWHTLKYMFINTMLFLPAVEQCSMATTSQLVCGHWPLPQSNFRLLNFPTITEMVVDQLEEAGYTISRQYFSVSAQVFSLASLP